jgi:hypothetical protein
MARSFSGQEKGEQFNPFDPRRIKPPPGVGASGGKGMAFDDAFGGVAAWANDGLSGLSGLFGAREGFIGFPQLAMLAQRPEYRSPVEIIATESTREWIKFHAMTLGAFFRLTVPAGRMTPQDAAAWSQAIEAAEKKRVGALLTRGN